MLFGGVGTLVGAVLGVGIIDLFSHLLSQQWETGWPIVLGLLLLVVVMFRPTGLVGFLVSERERVGSFGKRDATRKPDAPATRPRDQPRDSNVTATPTFSRSVESGRSTAPSPHWTA